MMLQGNTSCKPRSVLLIFLLFAISRPANSADPLPIADAHVHYSHDSVELTPPARVIELMREAGLKFALVSSSDDNGTQLLAQLAPELIVPGLRPYRRRGEVSGWFRDPLALEYVERLLQRNRYATIGEFHLYAEQADLPIPRRIVELADQHNLILHAHSDADAVDRLLAQSDEVKVLWAHSGFVEPNEIAAMLEKHDRLWADLAFRSEVGSGGQLSQEWQDLFARFPDRFMLGTDTYTPERMYFVPEQAKASRIWLATLPAPLAENIAWRNAWNLLMTVWQRNRVARNAAVSGASETPAKHCEHDPGNHRANGHGAWIETAEFSVNIQPTTAIKVSRPFQVLVTVCAGEHHLAQASVSLDAVMPAHGHGMNYKPEHTAMVRNESQATVQVDGLVLHMPGDWQWVVEVQSAGRKKILRHHFTVR